MLLTQQIKYFLYYTDENITDFLENIIRLVNQGESKRDMKEEILLNVAVKH